MSTSTKDFAKSYCDKKRERFYENLLVLYFFLGVFMENDVVTIVRYLLSIFIQVYFVALIIRRNRKMSTKLGSYLGVVFLIFLIAFVFWILGVDISAAINRLATLLAVFGVVIVGERGITIDIQYIVNKFVKIYVFLVMIINIDALVFMVTRKALWKPIHYIVYRYMGPFEDPNFMALFTATVLIILLCMENKNVFKKTVCTLVLIINILLAGSATTFLLLPTTYIFHKIFKFKNIFRKQLFLVSCYLVCLIVYINFKEEIEDILISILQMFYNDSKSASVKYISFAERFNTQEKALNSVLKGWWGQGPLQIVPQLGRDTHNSYVGILFEQGIIGLLLAVFSFRKRKNTVADYVSTYLILSAFLLNVHYTAIFSLGLLIQYMDQNKNILKDASISR